MLKHKIIEIAPKTWCLSEFRLVNTFLVEGSEKAALIDTGCGIGHLADCVRELTNKPLIILLTHDHFDHTGGIFEFPNVPAYLHEEDYEKMAESHAAIFKVLQTDDYNRMRKFYITSRGPIRSPDLKQEELLSLVPKERTPTEFTCTPMQDGDIFDLGGRKLEIIHTPGHTDGEVCILDRKERILFTGDTANKGIILARQLNDDTKLIKICNATMKKLWDRASEYDCLGVGHDSVTIDKRMIKDYYDLTQGLLDGTITGSYEEGGFRKGDVVRLGLAELWYQCDQ